MALRNIRTEGDEVLTRKCREVKEMTPRLKELVNDMLNIWGKLEPTAGRNPSNYRRGVLFGIALQNVPEGMVVIAPLLLAGVSKIRTFLISLAIGLLEIVGVWIGYALGAASEAFLPAMLGFAGGAMLYVTSDEMIPETHAHGYQKQATYALVLGFVTLILHEKII